MPQSHEHLCKPSTVSGWVQLVILTQRHLNGLLWEYNLVSCILFFLSCPHSVCSIEFFLCGLEKSLTMKRLIVIMGLNSTIASLKRTHALQQHLDSIHSTCSTFCYVTALFQKGLKSCFTSKCYTQHPIITKWKTFAWNSYKFIKTTCSPLLHDFPSLSSLSCLSSLLHSPQKVKMPIFLYAMAFKKKKVFFKQISKNYKQTTFTLPLWGIVFSILRWKK